MTVIKDKSISACICGVDDTASIHRTAKQRVLTWMTVIVAIGFATLTILDGFSLEDWSDPKGLVVLGLLFYCIIGIIIRLRKRLKTQKKHSFWCLLRRSFYDVV